MKKPNLWLMVPINLIPIALAFIFFYGSALIQIPLILIECTFLTVMNHTTSENVPQVIFLSLFQIASAVVAGLLFTYLYTKNVSDDHMSFVIGEFMTHVETAIALIASFTSIVIKCFRKKANI